LYDILAGAFGLGWSKFVGKKKLQKQLPNIRTRGLIGGVEYYDGQFDDARLAVNLAQTAIEHGAVVLNYFKVSALIKDAGKVQGVLVTDVETGKMYEVKAKSTVNATGVFVDEILKMDNAESPNLVRPSQGVHVVVDKKFLNSDSALLIPKTRDGRVLFAVPWQEHLIIGTTDTPLEKHSVEPVPEEHEIAFILETVNKYLSTPVERKDALSTFAGLRPLAANAGNKVATKELSRDHKLVVSESGLVTITGGKWTTFRKMAEETVDVIQDTVPVAKNGSLTRRTALHGLRPPSNSRLSLYGTDEDLLIQLIGERPELGEYLVNGHGYTKAEVVWAVMNEMARTIEDVLARRLRLLFLDADAAIEAAPVVAELMRSEFKWDDNKVQRQLDEFYKIAYNYTLNR
jgi:glycerol-3-phosphate dehydrogenase